MSEMELVANFRQLMREAECKDNCSDEFLLCFLRARKMDVHRALKLLINYLRMAEKHSDLMSQLKRGALQHCLDLRLQSVCRKRDQHGRRIFIFRAGAWDPSTCSLDDIFRCNVFYLQHLASERETQENGLVAVVDLRGFSLYQARQFSAGHARRIAELIKDSFPIRFQAIHLVHEPWIFGVVLAVIWPFLSAKIQQRVFSHGQSQESLLAHVDAQCLPLTYGGSLDPTQEERWIDTAATNLF